MFGDEGDGVGSFDAVADALDAAAEFVGSRVEPVLFGGRVGDERSVFHAFSGDGIDDGIRKRVGCEVVGLFEKLG